MKIKGNALKNAYVVDFIAISLTLILIIFGMNLNIFFKIISLFIIITLTLSFLNKKLSDLKKGYAEEAHQKSGEISKHFEDWLKS